MTDVTVLHCELTFVSNIIFLIFCLLLTVLIVFLTVKNILHLVKCTVHAECARSTTRKIASCTWHTVMKASMVKKRCEWLACTTLV